jgi:cytochrome P450
LSTFRMNARESEFCGVKIPEGSPVTAIIGAANRDPEVFTQPDEFEFGRSANRHLAFGSGPHRCIGAQMARIEARVGFEVLLDNAPGLRLEGDSRWLMSDSMVLRHMAEWFGSRRHRGGSLQWRRNAVTRGLRHLQVVC